jgi:hypothetical protein
VQALQKRIQEHRKRKGDASGGGANKRQRTASKRYE